MLSDRLHPDEARLPGLGMIGMVEASMTHNDRTSTLTLRRFHLSSARMNAECFATAVRAHWRARWRIENSLHRVLGVSFNEDQARNQRGNGPENLDTLRRLALNLLCSTHPDVSIRRKRKRSGWFDDFARPVLGQVRQPCLDSDPRLPA